MKQRIPGKRETYSIPRRRHALRASRQSGFTLVEVLVSAVVLSVGLIGVAGLQILSLGTSQSSFMRSQATALAYDLADRMRSNVAGSNAGFYNLATPAATANCGTTTGCTTQQMAENDLDEWETALETYLPMGEGIVCLDSVPGTGADAANPACDGNGNQFAIKIWWDDDRDGTINMEELNTERFVISFQL